MRNRSPLFPVHLCFHIFLFLAAFGHFISSPTVHAQTDNISTKVIVSTQYSNIKDHPKLLKDKTGELQKDLSMEGFNICYQLKNAERYYIASSFKIPARITILNTIRLII